ncbi:MAG: A/G-specific adenine glycosylase [Myxococcales bacterium]|nr:A/G-specific adenine glycosylase [Myxococcales bacterium]MDD9967111.1 A/G-specific adenine glycosylase [Myxococcales bacterium]
MRDLSALRRVLLAWYTTHARELPWRARVGEPADPYKVWVSEVMLQQTRVGTVLRYYDRFVDRFPTAASLAAAEEDEVMASWSGLGYYRRARLLHAGVKEVVAHYGGHVPEERAARSSLPGVGRYTAGAIGSIAFGRPEPIVDGNVMRVFARVFRIETPLGHRDTAEHMWRLAETLVAGERPGDLNQALMELGATVCTKASPACEACPVAAHCAARRAGQQANLPVAKARRPPRRVTMVAVLATSQRGRRVWLTRGQAALFGGLWNLPMGEGDSADVARGVLREAGLAGRLTTDPVARFKHVLTHRRLEVSLFRATARGTSQGDLRAAGAADLDALGISSLTRKGLRHGGFAG